MPRKLQIATFGVLMGALGFLLHLVSSNEPKHNVSVTSSSNDEKKLEALQVQVAQLRAEQRRSNHRLTSNESQPIPATESETFDEEEAEVMDVGSSERTKEVIVAEMNTLIEFYDSVVSNEATDSSWAGPAETEILAAMNDVELPESLVLSTECRQTLCRVELDWDDENMAATQLAVAGLPNQLGWTSTAQFITKTDLNGEPQAILWFVARDNHTLPIIQL